MKSYFISTTSMTKSQKDKLRDYLVKEGIGFGVEEIENGEIRRS